MNRPAGILVGFAAGTALVITLIVAAGKAPVAHYQISPWFYAFNPNQLGIGLIAPFTPLFIVQGLNGVSRAAISVFSPRVVVDLSQCGKEARSIGTCNGTIELTGITGNLAAGYLVQGAGLYGLIFGGGRHHAADGLSAMAAARVNGWLPKTRSGCLTGGSAVLTANSAASGALFFLKRCARYLLRYIS